MNILFINIINNVYGHKMFDSLIINGMSQNNFVCYVSEKDWYNYQFNESTKFISYKPRNNRYLDFFHKIMVINNVIKHYHIDLVVCSTFFVKKMITILKLFNHSSKFVLIHHGTTDAINTDSRCKRSFLKYANKVGHIVLEPFIGDFFVNNLNIIKQNVFVLPHPMLPLKNTSKKTIDCVSLGNVDNDSFFNQLIDIEKNTGFFSKNKLRVFFKSMSITFDNGYLKISNGYLSREDYDNYLSSAKTSLIIYPESFKYRVSGIAIDSIAHNSLVLCTSISLFDFYHEKYGNLFIKFQNINKFLELLLDKSISFDKEAADRFAADHSLDNIVNCFNNIKKSIYDNDK